MRRGEKKEEERRPLVECNNEKSLSDWRLSDTAIEVGSCQPENKENTKRPLRPERKNLEKKDWKTGLCEVTDVCESIAAAKEGIQRRSCWEDFLIGRLLGKGKYGRVYAAHDRIQERTVALKVISLDDDDGRLLTKQLQREIRIQGNISHSNIIHLYDFFIYQRHLYLVLEYANSGSLFDSLAKTGPLDEKSVAKCMKGLSMAVQHLHAHGVIHRDIKPENVMLGDNGEVKLGDFGWSVLCCKGRRKTLCGTLDYLAPEMLAQDGHDHRVDIWSLGVLCYELLFGDPPFLSDDFAGTSRRIKEAKFSFPSTPKVSKHAKDFIQKILVSDLNERLDLNGVLKHAFVKSYS